MARVITRYRGGSRKLYDRTESRYISLDEIPELIRRGERVRVVDNATGADVTGQVLAQVISESERRGVSLISAAALHEIIRSGLRQLERWLALVGGLKAPTRVHRRRPRRVRSARVVNPTVRTDVEEP